METIIIIHKYSIMPKRNNSKRSKKTGMEETVDSESSEMNNSNEEHTVTETPSKKLIMDFDSDQLFDKLNEKYGNDYVELLKYVYAFGKRDNRPALWSPVQKILKNLSGEGNRNRGNNINNYRGNRNNYRGNRNNYNGGRGNNYNNGGRESYQGNREDFQGGRRGFNGGYNGGYNRGRNGYNRGRSRGRGGYRGRGGNRNYQQYGEHDTGLHNTGLHRRDNIDNMETPELHD